VAFTWNSASKQINWYLNGRLDSTDTEESSILAATNDARIGMDPRGTSQYYFDGQIDEPQIFNYALTSAQVRQMYNLGAGVRIEP